MKKPPLSPALALDDKAAAAASALAEMKGASTDAKRDAAAVEYFASATHAAADRLYFGQSRISDEDIVKLIELTQATIRTELGELLPGVERKVPRYIYARVAFLEEHIGAGGSA